MSQLLNLFGVFFLFYYIHIENGMIINTYVVPMVI